MKVKKVDGQNGGSYSRFAKGFLFRSEEGRDDFIREAEALLSLNDGKAYAKGEIARAIRNAKVVDNDDLTPDAYRKRIGRTEMSDDLTVEEMFADSFEEVKDRVNVFKEMGVEQPSLAKRFTAWAKRIMDKFAEFFHNPEGKLTTAQRDSFVKAFGRLAHDMKDGEGRPLFKVYKEGKEIRLTSGQLVTEGIKLSAKNDIENVDKTGYYEGKKYDVTMKFNDIPARTHDFLKKILNNPVFAKHISSKDDIDSICDKAVAEIKTTIESLLSMYRETGQQRFLNLGAYYVSMVDEIRGDFNAGGQTYSLISGSRIVHGRAKEGSNLARSLQAGRRAISETTGKEGTSAVDRFSKENQLIVDAIRKQDRGDGVKFSVSMSTLKRVLFLIAQTCHSFPLMFPITKLKMSPSSKACCKWGKANFNKR